MHMHSYCHLEEELEHHSVHVGGRQHGYDIALIVQLREREVVGELDVGGKGAIWDHDALRESGSA